MDNIFLISFLLSFICLIVGLIKPTSFSNFIKGEITRKKIAKIFGMASIASFILLGVFTDSSGNVDKVINQSIIDNTQQSIVEDQNPTSATEGTQTLFEESERDIISTQFPASAPVKVEDKPAQSTNITVSQKNALTKAKSYLNYLPFSRDGLIEQLEYDQFSYEDAVYGVDNSGANWNEQAAKKAKSYIDYLPFSRGGLIDQLKYDKFTQSQAEYGASAVGL